MSDVKIIKCHKCGKVYKWKSRDAGNMHFGSIGTCMCPYCNTPPRLCDLFVGRPPENEPEETK